jgi:OPA family glycerol-3-phosphate transporter-like MFS transporter
VPLTAPRAHAVLRFGQARTIVLLFCGYAACYYCRADLSVATPLLAEDLGRQGLSHQEALLRIGSIGSLGVIAYALGKFFLTGLGDYWGGRRNFLIGLAGATFFTALFALGGALPLFTVAWVGNRLTQSIGWAGLVKVSSKWFDYSSYGLILGILSVSYLVGDAAARQQMEVLIEHGYGWRALFVFAAIVAAVALVASALFLRESRVEEGHPEAKPNPLNLYVDSESAPASVAALLTPLLRSQTFLLVCILSFTCTIVREAFNTWLPTYLHDHLGYSQARAAGLSSVFPWAGAVSALAAGWLSDRLGLSGRSLLLLLGLIATAAALIVLMGVAPGTPGAILPLATIALVAFCLVGPYSYLGGAFALDFGGKQASAATSGIIDGIGYAGGALAGFGVPLFSAWLGWQAVFAAFAAVCALSAVCAALLHRLNVQAARAAHE